MLVPLAALFTAMLLWSSAFIALKLALTVFTPLFLVTARLCLASVAVAMFWNRLRPFPYRTGDWRALVFMGLCEPLLTFLLETEALRWTSASQAAVVTALLPVLVALAAWPVLGERLGVRGALGCAISFSGVAWLTVAGTVTDQAPRPVLGNILEFLAMVVATGNILTVKRLSARYSPLHLTGFQTLFGAVCLLPGLLLPQGRWPEAFPLVPTLALLYLGVIVTLCAYGLYNFGISRIPAGQASAWINLIPVLTLVLDALLLGGVLSIWQCVAAALVLVGVAAAQSRSWRTPRPHPPGPLPGARGGATTPGKDCAR